jgi:biotin operon repressor
MMPGTARSPERVSPLEASSRLAATRASVILSHTGDNLKIAGDRLLEELPVGRHDPIPAWKLAVRLGTSRRQVAKLVEDLIDRGVLVGSTCNGERAGYFIAADPEDVEAGTRHIRSRALAMLVRLRKLRKIAERDFGFQTATLFDLETLSADDNPVRGR